MFAPIVRRVVMAFPMYGGKVNLLFSCAWFPARMATSAQP